MAIGLAAAGIAACVSNPAPPGWLAKADAARSDPFGAWIEVATTDSAAPVRGEFLGEARDSVFVLREDGAVVTVPTHRVARARIAYYDAQWVRMAVYTGLLSLSTISNGMLLYLTLPPAAIIGTIGSAQQSRAPLVTVTRQDQWFGVRIYARFPVMLPDSLPRTLPVRRAR